MSGYELKKLRVKLTTDAGDTRFGSGWLSGVLAVFFSALAFGGVLCLRFPALLSTPDIRAHYPVELLRGLIQGLIVLGFLFAALSAALRRRWQLPVTALLLALAAALWGGGAAQAGDISSGRFYFGLDWFLVDLLLMALLFIPIERLFARLPGQRTFRLLWQLDLTHFFFSHLLIQVILYLSFVPVAALMAMHGLAGMQQAIAGQPLVLQFFEIVLAADLAEYGMHLLFHRVGWMWRFHAVHHSARAMDWLASSRNSPVDILFTRAAVLLPLALFGFAQPAVYAYVLFLSFHAVFIHANVNFRLGWMERWLVTPRFHHWHHAVEPEAIDKNFAIHLPWIDRLFGTEYMPSGEWPQGYGIAGHPVPENFAGQLIYPFRRD